MYARHGLDVLGKFARIINRRCASTAVWEMALQFSLYQGWCVVVLVVLAVLVVLVAVVLLLLALVAECKIFSLQLGL